MTAMRKVINVVVTPAIILFVGWGCLASMRASRQQGKIDSTRRFLVDLRNVCLKRPVADSPQTNPIRSFADVQRTCPRDSLSHSALEMLDAGQDAWGNPFQVAPATVFGKEGFRIWSFGRNGIDEDGAGDDFEQRVSQ